MKMTEWKTCANIFIIYFIQGISCKNIQLSPTQAIADVNESFTFTCKYFEHGDITWTKWYISTCTLTPSIVKKKDGTCSGSGIFANDTVYRVGCPSETSFTVTILRVQVRDHNAEWFCFNLDEKSNIVTMSVNVISGSYFIMNVTHLHEDVSCIVPVSKVVLFVSEPGSTYIREHSRKTINCKSSVARPQPIISWYVQEYTNSMKHEVAVNVSTQVIPPNKDGLVAVESTLLFYPNRSFNGWELFCEGFPANENRTVQSNTFTMKITYPPKNPPKIDGYEDVRRYTLIESEVGKLSCNVYGGNPLPRLTWNCYNNTETTDDIDGENVTKNVTWIGARGQTSCSCISVHPWSGTTQSTIISVNVLYPPQKPTFTIGETNLSDVITIILNNTLQVMCESKGNPTSNFTWTGPLISRSIGQVLIVKIDDTNDMIYKCVAKNKMIRSDSTYVYGQNEANVTVKVLYPPGKPLFKYEYTNGTYASFDKKIDVIEGDTFTISCDAEGNPLPDLHWDGQIRGNTLKITSILSDTNKTCTAKYKMEETLGETRTGSKFATVSIEVLYPPKIPTITISNGTGHINVTTPRVQLKEMDNINITCFSEANPMANYTWASRITKVLHNIRQFANISRTDAGRYTCNVNNLMNRTFGEAITGSNLYSIFLNIMYPSIIQSLKDESVLEGSNLKIICRVQGGNPTEENVSWTRMSDFLDWRSNQLTINNVSRADDSNYICTLKTLIIPTIGNETVIHLNVLFPTEIKHFFVNRNESRNTVILYKTDEVSFHCIAESNPASDLSIIYPPGITISTVKNKNVLRHKVPNASYENAGIYTCEGRNNYTKYRPSISRLLLIIKSPPRPSPDSKFENNVAAALSSNKTLQFVAQDYLDEENKTDFMWFKQNISLPRNATRFKISSNRLYSNLSVRNITKTDFGQYSMKVTNSVGEYIHYYELKAEDKPDMPFSFTYSSESVTESSVTLTWTPGFNGGFPQTFTLLYKVSQEKKWQSISVKDNDKETMNYTLTGLISSKVYNIKIYAKNKLGNSSITHILHFTTKASVARSVVYVTSTGTFVGVGVGTFVGTVMIVVALLICYMRRKRASSYKDGNPSGSVYFSHSSSPYEDLDSSERDENVYNQVFVSDTYEQNDSQLQQLSTFKGTDSSTDNGNETVYVNLKIKK